MTTKARFGHLLVLGLLMGSGLFTSAHALELGIDNAGFESISLSNGSSARGIDGWTTSGIVGEWDPNQNYFGGTTPEGENVAYINYSGGYIEQTIEDYFLTADTTLTLSGEFGWRVGSSSTPSFEYTLLVGDIVLAQGSTALTQGEFTNLTFTYSVTAANEYLGLNPTIRITNTSSGGTSPQLLIDDISVTNHAVPEPGTLLLLGTGLLGVGLLRRKQKI